MKRADDPVGPENREWFDRTLPMPDDGPVVCGWGVHGEHMGQDQVVLGWLESFGIKPLALGSTRDGHPGTRCTCRRPPSWLRSIGERRISVGHDGGV